MSSTSQNSRPAQRQEAILTQMRAAFLDGTWLPGQRLPTRAVLEAQFGASSVTVQRVLDRLADDGYVESAGRRGTFVRMFPSYLRRYGVVYTYGPDDPQWNHRSRSYGEAARILSRSNPGISFRHYYGLESPTASQNRQILIDDIESRRIAGVIFLHSPHVHINTPIVDGVQLPRVAFMSQAAFPTVVAQRALDDDYCERVVGRLREVGSQRVAVLVPYGLNYERSSMLQALVTKLRMNGISLPDNWILGVGLAKAGNPLTRNLMSLLMSCPSEQRPDAVFVADDNCVADVVQGLSVHVSIPDELFVLAHGNFPCVPQTEVPVQYVGFDCVDILSSAIAYIDARNAVNEQAPSGNEIILQPIVRPEHTSCVLKKS